MGRSAIYLVMGMTFIFLFFGRTMNDSGTEAFENAILYYEYTQSYNIADAGANLACNQIFLDRNWRTGFSHVVMNDGEFSVDVDTTTYADKVLLTSTGIFQQDTHIVRVLLSPSSFSKFAMYSGNVSSAAKMRAGDTIDGPIHVNGELATQGNPVFTERATMGELKTASGSPTFMGGYQEGVNIDFPAYTTSADAIEAAANADAGTLNTFTGPGELWLKFSVSGGVTKVQYKYNVSAVWSAEVLLSTFAPSGNIAVVNGELHVEGTFSGQVSLTSKVSPSSTTPSATVGATYIEDDLRYYTDPLITPTSTDMLGLVSAGNIEIRELPIRMDGAFFTNENATLESSLRNNSIEQVKIVGSLISKEINSTDFGTGTSKGANFYMKYDSRLENTPPNNFPFPTTNSFEVLSWFE
ncbi:MAG: hypothetical protein WCW35_09960 [Bacteroidota bacterium]